MAATMQWFCGTSNGSHVTSHQLFRLHILNDTCLINFYYAIFHITFLIVLVSTQGILYMQTKQQRRFLLKSPGHKLRWIFSILLLLTHLVGIAEGVLSDSTRTDKDGSSLLYLYMPSICGLITAGWTVLLSHFMEEWHIKWPSFVLAIYWTLSCVSEIGRLLNLISVDLGRFIVIRYDVAIVLLLIYTLLGVIEMNHIRVRNQVRHHTSINRDRDESKQNMFFLRNFVSFPSDVLHSWMNRLLKLGYRKPLTIEDLGCLPEEHLVTPNHQKLKKAMLEEMNAAKEAGRNPSLLRILSNLCGKTILQFGLLRAVGDMFIFTTPFALSGIISYVYAIDSHPSQQDTFHFISLRDFFTNGFVLVFAIFFANIVERILLWTSQHRLMVESVHIRAALQAAVYEKSLQISSLVDSEGETNMGKITNYMSTDTHSLLIAMQIVYFVLNLPMTLATLLLLFNTLGISAMCGVAVCFIFIPVIVISGNKISVFQKKALKFSDERVNYTHQLLKEIKPLKLNAWEGLFCQNIEELRAKEVHQLFRKNLMFAVSAFCSNITPILMTLVSFGTYAFFNDQPLTPEIAFPSLALFSLLDRFLFIFPAGLATGVSGYVSIKRLERFLLTMNCDKMSSDEEEEAVETLELECDSDKEVTANPQYASGKSNLKPKSNGYIELSQSASEKSSASMYSCADGAKQSMDDDTMVQLAQCNLTWGGLNSEPILRNIDVEIKSGKLIMIVGPVGSGKSAFLASILGEMTLISGTINFPKGKPSMAFAAQRPWIQNATFRDNILCGLPMDTSRYNKLISACALEPDIELLPAGDATEIGERGINLSGGQKQRVNVARAIYSQAQLLILDDPLSALDVHVGSHLFEHAIMGLLRRNNRTVVLVTNQLHYLHHADKIIVLSNSGQVCHQGSYGMIAEKDEQLLSEWSKARCDSITNQTDQHLSEMERVELQYQVQRRRHQQDANQQKKTGENNKLIQKEEMARGSVILSVYSYLIRASGWTLMAFIVGFGFVHGLYLGKDFWLAYWSDQGERHPNRTTEKAGYFFGGYAGISIATIIATVVSQVFHAFAAVMAAVTLHKAMLNNVSKLPLRFFDTNPLGRVLNRFSNDMTCIDMRLFRTIDSTVYSLWRILACFVGITIVVPVFCVVAVIVSMVYFFTQRYYLKTSRELQRLENVNKSPVYAHFSETLDGLSTIRAFGFQQRFCNILMERIDTHSTTYMYLRTASFWLNLRLDFMGALVVFLAGLSTLIGALTSGLSPALVGLAIIYALRLSTSLSYIIKMLSDMEMQMNSVERIKHYATLPTERYEGVKAPSDWPTKGEIRFEEVSVKYADDLEPVLRDVNLQFHPQEKIGICGRTGSGKSSLVLALFRCNVTCKGHIYIDDINISDIPLTTLRQQLAIIPQDPTLFTGTIRKNLDPEEVKSDDELWNALSIAQLKSAVRELKGGLDAVVSEGGGNFSVGQRQLFCLARAFLRNSRILIMDEATASVDTETAKVLHELMTHAFADRTVLTIAHRISSILASDRIVVMSEGNVVEFDTPQELLANKDSMFSSIVHASKDGMVSQELRKISEFGLW